MQAIQQAGLRLGISTHDDAERERAVALRPSYIALGHIFPTQTKQMPSAPQGVVRLQQHLPHFIERLLAAGVRTIQLRIKDLPDRDAEDAVREAIALGRHYHARLFINDYWRLAIAHQAYGVHLGQEDLGAPAG
ncbi:hypothetical protein CRX72_26480 [Pantoea sp. BRM17]|nr:hypothetical protein CRX72_26480 [Pantoea sp. BRM17]